MQELAGSILKLGFIGSNQMSKRCSAVSISDCRSQGVFIGLSGRDLGPARQRRIRLLTKLEITPPSFFNPSRYGTDAGLKA